MPNDPKLNLNPIINVSTLNVALSDLEALICEVVLDVRTKVNKIYDVVFKRRIRVFCFVKI